MPKIVELRRHTDNDDDVLSEDGIRAAVEIGRSLGDYDVVVSSGAQRATQAAGCFLATITTPVAGGVVVDARLHSDAEDRWRKAYKSGGGGDLHSFRRADPELVESESRRFGQALRDIFESLPPGGRALVVGHSPMQEAAVFGLTGKVVEPLSKGAGVLLEQRDDGEYVVTPC
jgi:broad specificity phosphatase PhoE